MSWSKVGATLKRMGQAFVSGSLWLVVMIPILGVSGYSLFFVATHFGVPWYIAWSFSTCFDGVALLAARYSVKYAEEGLSGGGPRAIVRVAALTGAFLQTFHARLGNEPPGGWILWASLPIFAVFVYEMHVRWARRKALARSGAIYPSPLPSFGLSTWLLFPMSTLTLLREIVEIRRIALVKAAKARATEIIDMHESPAAKRREQRRAPEPVPAADPVEAAEDSSTTQEAIVVTADRVAEARKKHGVNRHSPTRHIRHWARAQGIYGKIGDRARLPQRIIDDYYRAHPDEERVG